MDDKAREKRARRQLRRLGFTLHKSRAKYSADNQGGYMLVDAFFNRVEAGERFDMSIDDVEQFITG